MPGSRLGLLLVACGVLLAVGGCGRKSSLLLQRQARGPIAEPGAATDPVPATPPAADTLPKPAPIPSKTESSN